MINKVPSLRVEHVDYSLEDVVDMPRHDEDYIADMLILEAKQDAGFYDWQDAMATISESPMEGKMIRITLAKVVMDEPLGGLMKELSNG